MGSTKQNTLYSDEPFFSHAQDYSWLQGQVEYSHVSKAWRLRYASVDETDLHGGSVTLVDCDLLQSLKDGQYVRVLGRITSEGEILQTSSTSLAERRNSSTHYRVSTIQPMGK